MKKSLLLTSTLLLSVSCKTTTTSETLNRSSSLSGTMSTSLNNFKSIYQLDMDLMEDKYWEEGNWLVKPSQIPSEVRERAKATGSEGNVALFAKVKGAWVPDHMFTKAVDKNGNHIRVKPYARIVGYGKPSSNNDERQASIEDLKRVMKAGDIVLFWHPEWNDFTSDEGPGQKEAVKFRSTHAGMVWQFDGENFYALNSPHGYHNGFFDVTHKYPFHIFRVMPNKKGGQPFTSNFSDARELEGLGQNIANYASMMSKTFRFPGDYNGGDPLNLFDEQLIGAYDNIITSQNANLPAFDSVNSLTPSPDGTQANLYCAEYVWTSATLGLNFPVSESYNPSSHPTKASFNSNQYFGSTPKWGKFATQYSRPWTSTPKFLYKPYTLWTMVEAFIKTYYKHLPRPHRAAVVNELKGAIVNGNFKLESRPFDASQDWTSILTSPQAFMGQVGQRTDKTSAINFVYDSIIATLKDSQNVGDQVTDQRLAMIKQVSESMMVSNPESGFSKPVAFVPPHSFLVEANKLDSSIVYVASAFPTDILRKVEGGVVAKLTPESAQVEVEPAPAPPLPEVEVTVTESREEREIREEISVSQNEEAEVAQDFDEAVTNSADTSARGDDKQNYASQGDQLDVHQYLENELENRRVIIGERERGLGSREYKVNKINYWKTGGKAYISFDYFKDITQTTPTKSIRGEITRTHVQTDENGLAKYVHLYIVSGGQQKLWGVYSMKKGRIVRMKSQADIINAAWSQGQPSFGETPNKEDLPRIR